MANANSNYATHHTDLEHNPIARAWGFDPSICVLAARDEDGKLIAVLRHTGAAFGSQGDVCGNRTAERLELLWHRDGRRGQINKMATQECRRSGLWLPKNVELKEIAVLDAAKEIKTVYGTRALI